MRYHDDTCIARERMTDVLVAMYALAVVAACWMAS